MRKKILKYKARALSALFLLCMFTISAQDITRERSEVKSFPAGASSIIQVENKYGNIHLQPWEKDSVRFEIRMLIKGNKESKVEKLFNEIDFEFTSTKYYVIVKTKFRSKNTIWAELSDVTSTLFNSGDNVEINYVVSYPAKAEVKLENKFGNIYTTEHKGNLDIKISNGDLKVNGVKGHFNLDMKFGDAVIDHVSSGRFFTDYAELDIRNIDELNIQTKSSTLHLGTVRKLNIQSRRDKIFIDQLKNLDGEYSFSYITIENLTKTLFLNSSYGELTINKLDKNFSSIQLNSEYTDVKIRFQKEIACKLDITRSEKTDLMLPEQITSMKEEVINKDDNLMHRSGLIGSGNTDAKINLSLKSGSLTIID